jgi:hypothetical protein
MCTSRPTMGLDDVHTAERTIYVVLHASHLWGYLSACVLECAERDDL